MPIVASYRKLVAVAKNRRQSIETFHYRLSELRYGSKCFHNIWLICSWLGSSKRSNSILHLFSTYFKFNSYKIEAKKALNLAKPHDFSRDGRSHVVVVSLRFWLASSDCAILASNINNVFVSGLLRSVIISARDNSARTNWQIYSTVTPRHRRVRECMRTCRKKKK